MTLKIWLPENNGYTYYLGVLDPFSGKILWIRWNRDRDRLWYDFPELINGNNTTQNMQLGVAEILAYIVI